MSKKRRNIIPLPHPQMRAQPGQVQNPGQVQINIDPSDVSPKVCEQCGHELFDVAYRYGVVSALLPKNPTGKDIPVKTEAFVCRACGWEFGKKPEIEQ